MESEQLRKINGNLQNQQSKVHIVDIKRQAKKNTTKKKKTDKTGEETNKQASTRKKKALHLAIEQTERISHGIKKKGRSNK